MGKVKQFKFQYFVKNMINDFEWKELDVFEIEINNVKFILDFTIRDENNNFLIEAYLSALNIEEAYLIFNKNIDLLFSVISFFSLSPLMLDGIRRLLIIKIDENKFLGTVTLPFKINNPNLTVKPLSPKFIKFKEFLNKDKIQKFIEVLTKEENVNLKRLFSLFRTTLNLPYPLWFIFFYGIIENIGKNIGCVKEYRCSCNKILRKNVDYINTSEKIGITKEFADCVKEIRHPLAHGNLSIEEAMEKLSNLRKTYEDQRKLWEKEIENYVKENYSKNTFQEGLKKLDEKIYIINEEYFGEFIKVKKFIENEFLKESSYYEGRHYNFLNSTVEFFETNNEGEIDLRKVRYSNELEEIFKRETIKKISLKEFHEIFRNQT
jgi:polyhydroxyalkanoate synthesis regulator phasin